VKGLAAGVECEDWRLGEHQAALGELDKGEEVSHEKISKWLRSWGKADETKAPR
jgi:predicted transcriptional regulator